LPIEPPGWRATNGKISADGAPEEGDDVMGTTIRARFTHGVLEPLEDAPLHDGDEVVLRIEAISSAREIDWLQETAGAWKGLVDAEDLKKNIRESRLLLTRPEARF
jgi:predicted DNA-binding antitoxin AbrB/MazE fold protein